MKLTELDKRYSGYGTWKYCVAFHGRREIDSFSKVRQWCWETWGASKEMNDKYDTITFDPESCNNPCWCWQNDNFVRRIYLREDEHATLLMLKWT